MSLQIFAIIAQLCLTPNGYSSYPTITRKIIADCQIKMTTCMETELKKYLNKNDDSRTQVMATCIKDGKSK